MSNGTGISILIRTSNSEKPLRRLLSRLQIGAQDEIIIVDTGSKDGTVALAERAGAKVVVNRGSFNYSRTLNLGFHAVKSERVLVVSAHCVPVNFDILERYRQALLQLPEAWAVVYGMQFLSKDQYDRCDKTLEICKGIEILDRLRGGGNTNALYSKRAWDMHGFDESLKTAEDLEWKEWAARTGLVCAKAAEAACFYRHPGGPIYRFRKAYDEVSILEDNHPPIGVYGVAIGVAHASWHLMWKEFLPRAWIGQVSHILGAFVASRKLLRPKSQHP